MSKVKKNKIIVLITGASSGLGLAIAKKLIKERKYFLILTARESSQFKFANQFIKENKNLWLRILNVSDHQQISTLINEINETLGGVDILINNAGITDRSSVEESTSVYRQLQLDVNYLAPLEIISQVLSTMRMKKNGQIINISSAGGFMAMPTMSAYSASKFALEGATESLWYEMKPWGIHVSLVIPGFINSEGFRHTTESDKCRISIQDEYANYHEHYMGMKNLINRRMLHSGDTNEKIANKILQLITNKNPPLRVYVTLDSFIFYIFRKFCPERLYLFIIYRFLPNISRWGKQPYKV